MSRVQELLDSSIRENTFTNYGPNVKRLESTLHALLHVDETKAVVAVSNGTAALCAAVAALELAHNTFLRFATQAFTFPASAQGYLKDIRIVDIDREGGLDLTLVNPDDVDGLIVTNVFGNVVNLKKYEDWCSRHKKYLILDNAATSYSFYETKNSCNYGTASIVSLHHTKPIGFGEGGCIIIDKQYEHALRRILNFGIDNNSPNPFWDLRGSNYKMSEIQAVYILQYLDQFHTLVPHIQRLYTFFFSEMRKRTIPFESFPNFAEQLFPSCLCFFTEKSEQILDALMKQGVYCRKYYKPLISVPVAHEFYKRIVCIPCTMDMTESDITSIVNTIESVSRLSKEAVFAELEANTPISSGLVGQIAKTMKGNTFHHHYHILYTLRSLLQKEKAVYTEIGTFNGGSLCLMLQHPQYTECWSIDPFHLDRTNISITEENLKMFNIHTYPVYLTKQFSTSPGLLQFFEQSQFQTDILFIDGDHGHDAVRFDFHMYWKFVSPGGYIVFDDYHDALYSPEVKGAVDSIVRDIQEQDLPFEILGSCSNFGNVHPESITNLNEFLLRRK